MDTELDNLVIDEAEQIEITLLLEGISRRYGFDFRDYARPSITRRVLQFVEMSKFESVSHLTHVALRQSDVFERLLICLSINVTEMFRDPPMFRLLREEILPKLASQPMIKIWHAGCSSGEEVYSMAILLTELGLADRARIFATDFNQKVLDRASKGIFSLDRIQNYTGNYQQAGGTESFADYYTADYDSAIMAPSLRKNTVFSFHNLVTDGVFSEMDLILCRNVLIYFSNPLQDRVFSLFHDSLSPHGFLCLGSRESLRYSEVMPSFRAVNEDHRIYQKCSAHSDDMLGDIGTPWTS